VHLFFRSIPQWFERRLIGAYPENVRANIRIELLASFWYGLFFAASLTFFPVILRRLGATPFELALYVVFRA
jgi:DHA1 family inner membrane transport protein